MAFQGEHIWIIGASSGIGAALASELSNQGATLILSARRQEELETLNADLGGHHHVMPLDVANSNDIQEITKRIIDTIGRIDRVIFMAALYKPTSIDEMDIDFAKSLMDVNVVGAIATTYAVLPVFERQNSGQIVLCGSVAGYTGLPGGQPYSASKAAIINFAESLHAEVDEYINVKVINPGFVRTRITDKNTFPMPMRIEPEDAAKAIAKGLNKRAFEIHFPRAFTLIVKLLGLLPYGFKLWVTSKMKTHT